VLVSDRRCAIAFCVEARVGVELPYASNRRGVQQAASYYIARSLDTLGKKEMLALAVLVRAPTRFDLKLSTAASAGAIERLASA
jgi:penicillin-binding protein 1C